MINVGKRIFNNCAFDEMLVCSWSGQQVLFRHVDIDMLHSPQLQYICANVAPSISRWLIVPLKDNFLFLNDIFTNDTILPLLQTGQLGARFHMNLIIKRCLFSNHRGGKEHGQIAGRIDFLSFQSIFDVRSTNLVSNQFFRLIFSSPHLLFAP